MLDFLTVATRSTKKDGKMVIEVYPKFIICKSKDLMIRGGDFYAVFNEENGLWSTEEDTLNSLVDAEIKKVYLETKKLHPDERVVAAYMIDSDSGSDTKSEGWEDSWAVRGIKPKLKFRETIIKCVVDNGYVDSADKVNPIDDWHYQLMAKVGFWEKNAVLISRSINDALEQAGWNMTVEVRVSAKDDASFIIDITKHWFGSYYALVQYDSNFGEFERDVQVSRKPDELYLQVIRKIFMYEDDRAARVEDFKSLLEDGHCEACDDDYVMEFRPRLLLRDGNIVAENLYDVFKYHEPIEYVELPDFDEEEDPQEAHDEFMENLEAEGKNLYCLNVK